MSDKTAPSFLPKFNFIIYVLFIISNLAILSFCSSCSSSGVSIDNKTCFNDVLKFDSKQYRAGHFVTYKNKDIYIVGEDLAKELKDTNPNNIYIIDDRCDEDPDMSICNSYKFKNIDDINTIINLLIEYEEKYPSSWNRSTKSMKNEWLIHNICYFLNIEKSRTEQVDFNNNDEEIYLNCLKILKEIINTNDNEIENIKTKVLVPQN